MQWSFGPEVEAGFQAREDADEQIVHARQTLGLRIDEVASPAHQQPDLQIEFGRRLDRAQVGPGADLVGDGPGVARVGLVLAADRALAGAVDRQARHVHEREPGLASMASARPAMPPMTSSPTRTAAAKVGKLVGEACDLGRRVQQLAVDLHDAVGVDGGDPVHLLGDVDPDADPHGALLAVDGPASRPRRRRPTQR